MSTVSTKTWVAKPAVPATDYSDGRPGDVEQAWWLVDAEDKILGRLASDLAMILMGKTKPTYTPHVDTGDFVVVINCEKIRLTGRKWEQRGRAWYTGYTRQRREPHARTIERRPEMVLTEAVRRMLPKNKLGRRMLEKLKVYAGPNHPHQAQQPEAKELG